MPAIAIEDIGFVEVEIDATTVTLDAFEVYNQVVGLSQKFAKAPVEEFHAAVAALMQEKGLPAVSHFAASRFVEQLGKIIEDLKKNPKSLPAVPASTESTPSGSPSES
jgi:hypothetical protein